MNTKKRSRMFHHDDTFQNERSPRPRRGLWTKTDQQIAQILDDTLGDVSADLIFTIVERLERTQAGALRSAESDEAANPVT